MSSVSLIEKEKDKEKFVVLYQKYINMVYYIAIKHLNNRELAEDCCQEVFLHIARNFQHINDNSTEESVKKYIISVALSTAMNMCQTNQ